MKMSFIILGALLVLSIFNHSAQAEEREIRTLGGAFIGKWKFKDVEASDALLEVDPEGRNLVKIRAGYVGDGRYAEYWQFEHSRLLYESLPRKSHYRVNDFRKQDGPKYFCGNDPRHCNFKKSEKVSRDLLIVQFHHKPSGQECAGLLYIGENFTSDTRSFGDYYAKSSVCLSGGESSDKALALSAHYLSLIRKDGRPIADLARYDLPQLE